VPDEPEIVAKDSSHYKPIQNVVDLVMDSKLTNLQGNNLLKMESFTALQLREGFLAAINPQRGESAP